MHLFKARQKARAEFERVRAERGLTEGEARERYDRRRRSSLDQPRHVVAGTAANQLLEL
jgi:hypothetical protein